MKPTVSPIISLLSLFLALVPLRLPAQTPYTLSALDVDMVGDTIKFFHYAGSGEVPEWILIPENLGVRVIDRFGYSVLYPNIKRVSFPHTLRKISSHAFDTFSIEHIDLNPELEVIGEAAFCDNRISEVSIPDSLIYCGQRAFWANFVREINWPERRVKHFDYFAGFEADSVKYVEIPSYVTTIQDYAFYGNALDSVKFCEGLDSIRSRAFAQRGIIPTDVPLEVVIFAPLKKLSFSNSLKYIGVSAFYCNHQVESIEFGHSLTKIDRSAFCVCASLRSLVLPPLLESIGDRAFRYCLALDSVAFDDALTFIGDSAFCDCKSLRKLLFNPNLQYIGNYAFANSPQLSDYTLPESLTHLGVGAFRNTLVDDLRIPPGIRKVPRLAFAQCSFTPAATVTLAEGIDEICDSAFFRILPIMQDETYADSVTLILPSTLKRIGFSAFETVWLKASKLPEHDESGAPIVWKAYLNGVLQEDDVRFIGGYMRTGRQRAALYEYVCEPRPNSDQSSLPSVPSPSSPSRLFDLSGRPASSSASGLHVRLSQDGSSRLELRR